MRILLQIFVTFLGFIFVTCKPAQRTVSGAVDMTLMSGASGEEVVEACIRKIESLEVFSNDFGILKRIAYVETEFGTNYDSKDRTRGIWQISKVIRTQLQTQASSSVLVQLITSIGLAFGSTVVDFSILDFAIPLHSAIAVRLYIDLIQNTTAVPGSYKEQDVWWQDNYQETSSTVNFTAEAIKLEAHEACPDKKVDLWILLDGSTSIRPHHFETAINFIKSFTSRFLISPDTARIGMSTYSYQSSSTTVSKFNEDMNNSAFENVVTATVYPTGPTYTGSAMYDVISNGFNVRNGARPLQDGIPRALLILTDGYSLDDVDTPSALAHASGITTFAAGIGTAIKLNEIRNVASRPFTTYSYSILEFDELLNALPQSLSIQTCKLPAFMPHDTTLSIAEAPGGVRSLVVYVPTTDAIVLTIQVSNIAGSSGKAYLGVYPDPNAALYVASLSLQPGVTTTLYISSNSRTRSADVQVNLNIEGLETENSEVPLYINMLSDGSNPLEVDFQSIVTVATTTTSSPVVSTTTSVIVVAESLDWWIILIICLFTFVSIFLIGFLVLFILGVSRSSKYPQCNNSLCRSLCASCFGYSRY